MATKVIGIECGFSSQVYEIPFNDKLDYEVGDEVIFKDPENKEEYGAIKHIGRDALDNDKVLFTSRILRKASANDIQKVESYIDAAADALEKCKKIVESLGLGMAVFRASYSLDGTRVNIMFTADDRVDFRDLVKELAKVLKKQVHLRQIGPRDKAKMIGGFGKCGRPLCCSTWLGKLESIGMEMVRVQALESKGSSKLSGACGKLLCCLKYEVDAYRELRKALPNLGDLVRLKKRVKPLDKAEGIVIALDILNQKLKVAFEAGDSLVVVAGDIDKVLRRGQTAMAT